MIKELVAILPEESIKKDEDNKIIYYHNDYILCAGYNQIFDIESDKEQDKFYNPPYFYEVELMSILIPIKLYSDKDSNNQKYYFCYYKNSYVLVQVEHLHIINNKYKYICM